MERPRQYAAASNFNGKLFVTGGCDIHQEEFNSVEYYSPETDKWCEVAPMNEKRARHGCKVIDGSLYVYGGYNKNEAMKIIERYDERANIWITVMFFIINQLIQFYHPVNVFNKSIDYFRTGSIT